MITYWRPPVVTFQMSHIASFSFTFDCNTSQSSSFITVQLPPVPAGPPLFH